MRSMWRSAIVGALLLLATRSVSSQPAASVVRWGADIVNAEALLPTPRSYRLFQRTPSITLAVSVVNDSRTEIVIDSASFRAAFIARVSGVTPLPTKTKWEHAIARSRETFTTPLAPQDQIRIEPGSGFSWRLTLLRGDGEAFQTGDYLLELAIADASSFIREADGTAFHGTMMSSTALRLAISPATTAAERAAMYRFFGTTAVHENRSADAVQSFARALELAPGDVQSLAGLGTAYLQLNRFREAIAAYERVLPAAIGSRSIVPMSLALAYTAVGDDSNARRILQLEGRTPSNIAQQLEVLRQQARQRGAR